MGVAINELTTTTSTIQIGGPNDTYYCIQPGRSHPNYSNTVFGYGIKTVDGNKEPFVFGVQGPSAKQRATVLAGFMVGGVTDSNAADVRACLHGGNTHAILVSLAPDYPELLPRFVMLGSGSDITASGLYLVQALFDPDDPEGYGFIKERYKGNNLIDSVKQSPGFYICDCSILLGPQETAGHFIITTKEGRTEREPDRNGLPIQGLLINRFGLNDAGFAMLGLKPFKDDILNRGRMNANKPSTTPKQQTSSPSGSKHSHQASSASETEGRRFRGWSPSTALRVVGSAALLLGLGFVGLRALGQSPHPQAAALDEMNRAGKPANELCIVTPEGARLRSGPFVKAPIVALLKRGAGVVVTGEQEGDPVEGMPSKMWLDVVVDGTDSQNAGNILNPDQTEDESGRTITGSVKKELAGPCEQQ